ncbi:hypothetical protein QU858_27080, partial [Escherichia coli]|nr:hypothetical protein [Escherichia coli]
MHEKNIALLCDEADRLLQLNINLLRQMVEEPDVLSDSKNENRRKRLVRTVLIFTESSDQLSRATDRVP